MNATSLWDESAPDPEPTVRLRIDLDPDTDPARADRITRQLRREIKELRGVISVAAESSGPPPPPGAKGDPVTIGAIIVALSASGGVLTALVGTLGDWLARRSERDVLVVTIDGDTLELPGPTDAERAAVVEAFVRRHTDGHRTDSDAS
ncbi:hypothetical protein ACFWIO_15040 [Streptomyces diastatochromogenes]|uniref:effector-associated constant component EACC1 n=1 Tax=Streptomyces diastatochromogenes TaxID=42236 RepID=UPI003654B280